MRENTKEKEGIVEAIGTVTKVLSGTLFKVQMENGFEVLGHLSGKMRKFNIRIAIGDSVSLEMSPYDLTKGRITFRHKA